MTAYLIWEKSQRRRQTRQRMQNIWQKHNSYLKKNVFNLMTDNEEQVHVLHSSRLTKVSRTCYRFEMFSYQKYCIRSKIKYNNLCIWSDQLTSINTHKSTINAHYFKYLTSTCIMTILTYHSQGGWRGKTGEPKKWQAFDYCKNYFSKTPIWGNSVDECWLVTATSDAKVFFQIISKLHVTGFWYALPLRSGNSKRPPHPPPVEFSMPIPEGCGYIS